MTDLTLYVACMNDGLFIIDKPPRPAPIDRVGPGNGARVIAKMTDNTREAQALAESFVANASRIAHLEDEIKRKDEALTAAANWLKWASHLCLIDAFPRKKLTEHAAATRAAIAPAPKETPS